MSDTVNTLRVLVVEDEYYIADDLARMLRTAGIAIAGPVANHAAAIAEMSRRPVDFAVVDINLDGTMSFEIATALRERGVPFMFLTGYDASVLPEGLQDVLLLQKPYDDAAVLAEIHRHRAIGGANRR